MISYSSHASNVILAFFSKTVRFIETKVVPFLCQGVRRIKIFSQKSHTVQHKKVGTIQIKVQARMWRPLQNAKKRWANLYSSSRKSPIYEISSKYYERGKRYCKKTANKKMLNEEVAFIFGLELSPEFFAHHFRTPCILVITALLQLVIKA